MNYNLQQQIAVTLIPNYGNRRIRNLIHHFGSLDNLFSSSKKDLKAITGIGNNLSENFNLESALILAEKHANYIEQKNIKTHFYTDTSFPYRLNECYDAPLLLFSSGKLNLNEKKIVSVVGTRNMSPYGKRLVEDFISEIRSIPDLLVVSGLAYGVDIYTHELCVKNNIPTIAVLAHGLDRIYPSIHHKIASKMKENGGLLTEFLPKTNPDRENFPIRNRIVAGIADATIVIESGVKGGSLITAKLAREYDREVFAFPGEIYNEYSKGCHTLIQNNIANLLFSSSDFITQMNWKQEKKQQLNIFEHLDPKERNLLSLFKERVNLHFDQLYHLSSLSMSELSGLLLNLELQGFLSLLPGKFYKMNNI